MRAFVAGDEVPRRIAARSCKRIQSGSPQLRHTRATPKIVRCVSSSDNRLTVDIKRYLEETEKNIVELNKNRLKALEDLNKERSYRLEAEIELAKAREELENLKDELQLLTQASPLATKGVADISREVKRALVDARQEETTELASKKTAEEAAASTITLHYSSGWSRAYIHYNVDSKGWTKSPGVKMERRDNAHVFCITGKSLEFVLNNGREEWDQPFPIDDQPQNYRIKECGTFYLRRGKVQRCE